MLAGVLLASTCVIAPIAVPSVSAAGTITLLEKHVAPTTTPAAPALPGTLLTYTITYDCSGINIGDNCAGAVITDVLPTFTDIYGGVQQLDLVSATASVPSDWTLQGASGAEPATSVSWLATANLEAGDSGAVILVLRVPNGIVPATPIAQQVDNSATVTLTGQLDSTVGPATSYINALLQQTSLSKSGPASALLNAAGTDPISHTISICASSTHALSQYYDVTDTLPVGATVVAPGSLPFGGVYTPGTPSTSIPPVLPATEPTIVPGTGGTVVWHLDPANHPVIDVNGCMALTFQVSYQNAAAGGDLTNEIGATKTNSVSVVASVPLQNVGPATTTLTLNGPVTRFSPSKNTGGNYYVRNGDTVLYNLGASNTSDAEAVPFSDATLTDGPFPNEFTLTEVRTGTWTGSGGAVSASIETSPDGTTWTQIANTPSTTVAAGLAGVRYVRWVFTSTGAPAIGPGWSASGQRLTGTVAGSPPPSSVITNCASLAGVQAGVEQSRGQSCARLELETPQPHPDIAKTSPTTLEPGETITYTLTASNNSDATGALTDPQLTDCVPDSDHLIVSNLRANGVALPSNGWSVEAGPTPHGCTPTQPSAANSGTFIQLQYTGSVAPGTAAPSITYDVTADSFHFPTLADTPVLPGVYKNTVQLRDPNGASFGHCVQPSCQATNSVTVPVTADLRSEKLVKGVLDNDFNKAGTTTPGGRVTWKIEVQNVGNVNVDQVQYVDVFGYVGDTGVRRTDQNRGSEFAPFLTSPITAPPGWTVEYSLTNNPCRPEVLGPNTGCVAPNWTTTPNLLDLPDYRSVRFTFAGLINVGDTLAVQWDMATPVFDPSYDSPSTSTSPYDVLDDCTIPATSPAYPFGDPGNSTLLGQRTEAAAWVDTNLDGIQQAGEGGPTCPRSSNSFAYGVHVPANQLNGLPDPGRLGAEPPKVDVHVAAPPPPNSIGSRVWNDVNNDGIQGPPAGEPGIASVRVDLFDGTGTFVQTTFTDLHGDYSFDLLPDGDYFVRFYMPDNRGYISPQDASGVALDVGAANTDDDSDIPETPSGIDAGANYYDTTLVSLGDVVSQTEADPSWDAGIWIPNPSISLKKYVNGNDAQTTPGPQIPRGNAVTWTYDVVNTGNTYLKNVTLVDDVTISAQADPVPVCNWAASSDAATPAGVLSPGETVSCTASGTAIRGQYGNNATVTGTPTLDDGVTAITGKVDANGAPLPTTVSDSDPAHYFGVEYDLALAKVANVSSVVQGGTVVWTIRVDNQGNVGSGNYTVTDSIPAGLTFVSSVPAPTTVSGRTLTFNQTNLGANGTRNITITTTVSDINMRPFVNWAEISADSAASNYSTTDWDSVPNANIGDDAGAGPLALPGTGPDDLVVDNTNVGVSIPDTVPNDEDDNDYANVTGNVIYDLALVKTVTPTPLVGADGLATWTITVKNQGNLASGAYTVTDRLPAGLDFLTSTPVTAAPVSRVVSWSMPNLAAGATATITITTHVNAQAMKSFVNWAEISADSSSQYSTIVSTVTDVDSTPDAFVGDDPGAGTGTGPTNSVGTAEPNIDRTSNSDVNTDIGGDEDDSDQAVLNSDILYDLALIKTVNASTVQLADTITWTITVKNQGNVPSHGYTVTDTMADGLTITSATPAAASTVGQNSTWNMPSLAAGATATIVITTTIDDVTLRNFRNWAEISADSSADYATSDEDSTPDTNAGTDNLAGLGTSPNDVFVDQTVLPVAQHNDPSVDEDDNDLAEVAVNVVYDLALVKTVNPTPLVGADGLATWTITVKNQGNVPSGAYSVTDRLPVGLTYLSSNLVPLVDPGRLYTWTMPNLLPGQTATITVDTVVNNQAMKPFVNWAEISTDSASIYSSALVTVTDVDSTPDAFMGDDQGAGSGTGPTNGGGFPEPNIDRTAAGDVNTDIVGDEDDSDQAVLNSDILYDLALVKTVDASPVQPDDTITWTITIKNQGNVPSHGYTVTDHMADGLSIASAVPAATTEAGQDLTWDMPNLAPGATATIVITTTIDDVNKRPFRNWAEISDDSAADYATIDDDSAPDTNVGNDDVAGTGTGPNDVAVDQTVLPVAQHNDPSVDEDDNDLAEVVLDVAYDLAVAKVADVSSIDDEGDVINYTVTVANQGNLPSGQFTVVDTIPAGLNAPTAITGGGVWALGARTITWTIPNLAVAGTLTFTYTVTVGTMALPNNVWRNLVEITADSSAFYSVSDIDSTPGNGSTSHGVDNEGPNEILQAGTGGDVGYDDEDIAVVTSGAVYDLALAKTNVVTGTGEDTNIDYEILVENQGTLSSRAYTVLDIVPPGLVVDEVSISDGGVYDAVAGTITWSLTGLLPADPPRSLTWSATVGDFSLRPYRNYAEISQDGAASYGLVDIDSLPDSDNTNDTELLTYDDSGVDNLLITDAGNGADPEDDADIADASVSLTYDLALSKVPSATTVSPSGTVTFTVVVENQGDVNSGDFTVTDALPAGTVATAASDGGTFTATKVTWHLTNLAPGATRTVTVTVAISDASKRPFKNIAEISADGADEYDAVVPFIGSDVEDADSVPDLTTTNDNGQVPGDGYGIFEAPLNDLDGIADVDSIPNGEDDADVAFFDVPVLYDLALVKTGPAAIDGAGTATFTIQVKNQGTVASGNFTVLDTIPAGLTAVSASNGGTIAGQSVTWNLSGLAAGATTSVTVTVRVANFASRPWVNIAEISADGADSYDSTGYQNPADGDVEDDDSIPDANPSNDALIDQTVLPGTQHNDPAVDSDDHDVAPIDAAIVYDLALVKVLPGSQSFKKGSNITFILQIKNQGNVDSGTFTVHDVLPAGLTFVSATDNPLVAGQSLTWDLPSMAPGGTLSITIVTQIVDVTLASYINLAEIVTDGADTYDGPGKDVEDKDSTPDENLQNDPLVDTDDVNIDHIPGDEDDHDRALLDTAKVASDNPTIGKLPSTGSDTQSLLFTAAGLLGAGALALLVTRRRRRRTSAA